MTPFAHLAVLDRGARSSAVVFLSFFPLFSVFLSWFQALREALRVLHLYRMLDPLRQTVFCELGPYIKTI